MLRSMKLLDFQSHKRTKIRFGPGVNVIKGLTDSGKTSIFRALHWISFNRPLKAKEVLISNWSKRATVEAQFDDVCIERSAGKTGPNTYTINGRVLKAVGKDVPSKVVEAINMLPENFQMQHDPLFLLSRSPRELAKFFNTITGLDIIDTSLQFLETSRRDLQKELSFTESALAETEAKRKSYGWVVEAEGILVNAAQLIKEIVDHERTKYKIENCMTEITACRKKLKTYTNLDETEELLKQADNILADLEKTKREKEALDEAVDNVSNTRKKFYRTAEEYKGKVKKLELAMPDVCPLCEQPIKKKGKKNGKES